MAEILLRAARSDIYRINAFRIARLPVDVSAREMAQQMEKLKLLEKLGGRLRKAESALSLKPAPNSDTVREAMDRLRDPECRLLDEFLWFWPAQFGEGKTDQTLTLLDQGNLKAASNAWLQAEKTAPRSRWRNITWPCWLMSRRSIWNTLLKATVSLWKKTSSSAWTTFGQMPSRVGAFCTAMIDSGTVWQSEFVNSASLS